MVSPGCASTAISNTASLVQAGNPTVRAPRGAHKPLRKRLVREAGPDKRITVKKLYQVYRDWAEDAGQKVLARNMFGKELRDVVPTFDAAQSGARRTYVESA